VRGSEVNFLCLRGDPCIIGNADSGCRGEPFGFFEPFYGGLLLGRLKLPGPAAFPATVCLDSDQLFGNHRGKYHLCMANSRSESYQTIHYLRNPSSPGFPQSSLFRCRHCWDPSLFQGPRQTLRGARALRRGFPGGRWRRWQPSVGRQTQERS